MRPRKFWVPYKPRYLDLCWIHFGSILIHLGSIQAEPAMGISIWQSSFRFTSPNHLRNSINSLEHSSTAKLPGTDGFGQPSSGNLGCQVPEFWAAGSRPTRVIRTFSAQFAQLLFSSWSVVSKSLSEANLPVMAPVLGPILASFGRNLAPSWLPLWSA